MKKWLYLATAIVSEVIGSLSLKAATTNSLWFGVVVVAYLFAFFNLSRVLKYGMPVGVAYGIWGATGVALTAVLATSIFNEAFTSLMGIGVAVVIVGVLTVELGSHKAQTQEMENK